MMTVNVFELIFLLFLLPGLIWCRETAEFFGPSSFISSQLNPGGNYARETRYYLPPYSSDLQSDESKLKESPKRSSSSSKKILFRPYDLDDADVSNERFTPNEFSHESNTASDSREHDDRHYAIGTKIRVQHPPSAPRKTTPISYSKPTKSSNHPDFRISNYNDKEVTSYASYVPGKPRTNKHTQIYDSPEPPITKSSASSSSYNVYEPEQELDDYSLKHRYSHHFDQLKGVASKKQIEKYLEDQQKLLDEALKIQLLKNPRLQQYFRNKENERLINEPHEAQELHYPNSSQGFLTNFNDKSPVFSGGPGRRSPGPEFNRPFKNKPPIKSNKVKSSLPRRFRSAIVINV